MLLHMIAAGYMTLSRPRSIVGSLSRRWNPAYTLEVVGCSQQGMGFAVVYCNSVIDKTNHGSSSLVSYSPTFHASKASYLKITLQTIVRFLQAIALHTINHLTMSRTHYEELLGRVEDQHARYLRTLRELYESLTDRSGEPGVTGQTPPMKPLSIASTFASELSPLAAEHVRRPRRLTNEFVDRKALKNTPASLLSIDIDSSDDEDAYHLPPPQTVPEVLSNDKMCVQEPLKEYVFHDFDLYCYIKQTKFTDATQIALDDVFKRRDELEFQSLFRLFNDQHDKLYDSAAYEVYDIGKDGLARQRHSAEDNDERLILEAKTVWDTVKVSKVLVRYHVQLSNSKLFVRLEVVAMKLLVESRTSTY